MQRCGRGRATGVPRAPSPVASWTSRWRGEALTWMSLRRGSGLTSLWRPRRAATPRQPAPMPPTQLMQPICRRKQGTRKPTQVKYKVVQGSCKSRGGTCKAREVDVKYRITGTLALPEGGATRARPRPFWGSWRGVMWRGALIRRGLPTPTPTLTGLLRTLKLPWAEGPLSASPLPAAPTPLTPTYCGSTATSACSCSRRRTHLNPTPSPPRPTRTPTPLRTSLRGGHGIQ